MIQVMNLKKAYQRQEAVRGIAFNVQKGQMLALLGPNGAGKTTTIHILCTCMKADSGSVIMDGFRLGEENREIRKRIGVVFQNGVLDELLTVEENLSIRGHFYGYIGKVLKRRIDETAEMTGITALLGRRYGQLSGGQRRRCDIARALLHMPSILLLDEPTTGLDPEIRVALWETISRVRLETGMTILLTTHYMEEAAKADYIVIMKQGKIAVKSTPEMLKNNFSKDTLFLYTEKIQPLHYALNEKGIMYEQCQDGVMVPISKTIDALSLLEFCRGRYKGFEVLRGSMEDAYLSVIEGGHGYA